MHGIGFSKTSAIRAQCSASCDDEPLPPARLIRLAAVPHMLVVAHVLCTALLIGRPVPRRSTEIKATAPAPPPPPISSQLLVADCTAIALYSLQLSSFKSFALALSDFSSPDFDLAADISSFDLSAVSAFVGVEQFLAASLVVGWLVGGGLLSDACSEDWQELDAAERLANLLRGWAVATPVACALKYGVFANVDLPTLGRTAQAVALESQLAGFTLPNVCADTLGVFGVLLLWRQLLLKNDFML